jgi:protein tyrosine/serine phosphatase
MEPDIGFFPNAKAAESNPGPQRAGSVGAAFKRARRFARRTFDPLRSLRGQMRTPLGRALGHLEHLVLDHAFMRYAYLNRHPIAPGVERSAQPSPLHVRAAAARGIGTIVNLRGARPCASYLLEREACEAAGIRLVDFPLASRAPPLREQVLDFDTLTAGIETPVLLHCKAGADRVGLASALYLMLRLGRPVEEALGQLHLRYGHIRHAKTGLLYAFLMAYKRANDEAPIDFRRWVQERYDPNEVRRNFRTWPIAELIADRVLTRE